MPEIDANSLQEMLVESAYIRNICFERATQKWVVKLPVIYAGRYYSKITALRTLKALQQLLGKPVEAQFPEIIPNPIDIATATIYYQKIISRKSIKTPSRAETPRRERAYPGINKSPITFQYRVKTQINNVPFQLNKCCSFQAALQNHDALMYVLLHNKFIEFTRARFFTELLPSQRCLDYAQKCYAKSLEKAIADGSYSGAFSLNSGLEFDKLHQEIIDGFLEEQDCTDLTQELEMLDTSEAALAEELLFAYGHIITQDTVKPKRLKLSAI